MYITSCESFIYFRAVGAEIYNIDYQNYNIIRTTYY